MRLVNPEIRQPRCPDKPVVVVAAGAACEPSSAPAIASGVVTIGSFSIVSAPNFELMPKQNFTKTKPSNRKAAAIGPALGKMSAG
jgi:hypothetical protein